MFDPISQRKVNQQANMLRSSLFKEGLTIERGVQKANTKYQADKTDENKSALTFALGKLSGYLALRRSLCPTIGADVAMNTQGGLLNKLCKELDITHRQFR